MRRYETILILDPDLSEDGRAPLIERIGQFIPQQGGLVVEEDHWGARKLAYDIKRKQTRLLLAVRLLRQPAPWSPNWNASAASTTAS